MLHFRGGRAGDQRERLSRPRGVLRRPRRRLSREIADLAARGCRYLQLDDTNLAYLCDPEIRAARSARGDDPDALPRLYCRLVNDAIRDRPADMTISVHLCRGNFKSAWVAEGGYEPVAEILLNEMKIDGFFLEYDDERSGDFAPLRFAPKGKIDRARPDELQARRARRPRTRSSAGSTRPRNTCRSSSARCRPSAASPRPRTATTSPRTTSGEARRCVEVAREVWGDAERRR